MTSARRSYEYRHVVGLEETNAFGNVYFTHYVSWQGRCREMFLRDHVPSVLDEMRSGLRLATVRVTCDYIDELVALDRVIVRMTLKTLKASGIHLCFTYSKEVGGAESPVARGEQEIACLRHEAPASIPPALRDALRPYEGEVE